MLWKRWHKIPQFKSSGELRSVSSYEIYAAMIQMRYFPALITGDESWVYHYDPGSKQESMEWRKTGEAPLQNLRCDLVTKCYVVYFV